MSSSRMCVSGCPMIRMFGRRCCSTRWRLWVMRRAIPPLCGRYAIGVFDRLVAPVRVPGVGPLRLLIIRRVRSASGIGWNLGTPLGNQKRTCWLGPFRIRAAFRAWITSSQDQPHLVEGIDAVLRRLGGTARRWRVDRMATVVVPGADRIQPSFVGVAKHYGPTSVRKERPPSSSKPKGDTKTHAHSPFTPNQETKPSRNSLPYSTTNVHFDART